MDGFSSKDLIRVANEKISIYSVCTLVGVDMYQGYGSNSKLYCPFGNMYHIDGGNTRAFRVYFDTNSAYCFACSQYFNSVDLFAQYNDMSREQSAEVLLDMAGWKEPTYEEKWEKINEKEAFNTASVIEALNIYCGGIRDDWNFAQLQEPYSSAYLKCLNVTERIDTLEKAQKWLEVSKNLMRKVLTDED